MKMLRGHDTDVQEYRVEGIPIKRCPIMIVGNKVDEYINAYFFFKSGMLPHAGGWADQPNKVIEAIMFIDAEFERMGKDGRQGT